LVVVLLGLALCLARSRGMLADGVPVDTDTLQRLEMLKWCIPRGMLASCQFARDAAPNGLPLHWTLPYDAFLAAISAPLVPFIGWPRSIDVASLVVGPIALLLQCAATIRLCAAAGMRSLAPWALLVLVVPQAATTFDGIGIASHHPLASTLATLAMAASLSLSLRGGAARGMEAAVWTVLSCWEGMDTIAALAAAWGVVAFGTSRRRPDDPGTLTYSACLAALAPIPLLLDPDPAGFTAMSVDRYSSFHVLCLLAMSAALPVCAAVGHGKTGWQRAWRCVAAAAAPGIGLMAIAFSRTPEAFADQRVVAYFIRHNADMAPAWHSPVPMSLVAFPAMAALPVVVAAAWKRRRRPTSAAFFLAMGIMCSEFALGLERQRLAAYAGMLAAPIVGAALRKLAAQQGGGTVAEATDSITFMCAAAAFIAAVTVVPVGLANLHTPGLDVPECHIGSAAAKRIEAALPSGAIVLADVWLSPELLRRTGLRTVAGPYHRNLSGLRDEADVFMGSDDARSRSILHKRGAAAVLACVTPSYAALGDVFSKASLESRLAAGKVPDWLKPVDVGPSPAKLYLPGAGDWSANNPGLRSSK
jgi:hypothetical protein